MLTRNRWLQRRPGELQVTVTTSTRSASRRWRETILAGMDVMLQSENDCWGWGNFLMRRALMPT